MNTSKVLSFCLVLLAVFVFVVAMLFFFGKKGTKAGTEESSAAGATTSTGPTAKVLNVVTSLPNERVEQMKASLGESYLFDARFKSNAYQFSGVTVSVVSGELPDYPGYTKYTHTFPSPFKGERVVFDGSVSSEFFEDPVTRLTTYFWFNSLLFLTLTTEKTGDAPVTKHYHYSSHYDANTLRWERFDRDPTAVLDMAVLGPKLDELNVGAGNAVALGLDEYLDGPTGAYTTVLNGVTAKFHLTKRSSSQTGFVKFTHKLMGSGENAVPRPFKLKKFHVSGTELADLVFTNKPVISVSVFWWYNVPLLAELDLHGGLHEHFAYNVETNNWEREVVERLRSKLNMLKTQLGDPLTLDLSKTANEDQTYTSNGVLVRVSPGATSGPPEFVKFTHRFTTGNSHFVGAFTNAGSPQMGLPVVRLNDAAAYYLNNVPVLLKLNLATSGSLSTKYRYYSNNGFGVWNLVELDETLPNTAAVLKKLAEDHKRLAESDHYVVDAKMRNNYLSNGKVMNVFKENVRDMEGYHLYKHKLPTNAPFKFEKFTMGGKDVAASAEDLLPGVDYTDVYWFLDHPLLVRVHGNTVPTENQSPPGTGSVTPAQRPEARALSAEFNFYYAFNAQAKDWAKLEEHPDNADKLKAKLTEAMGTLGTVTLNLGNNPGVYKVGPTTVTVADATPYDNDPPTTFTKRVHTLNPPFPLAKLKHFDFDLVLAKTGDVRGYASLVSDPVVPPTMVVTKVELYMYGEVPLHLLVYGMGGTPHPLYNTFTGTVWRREEPAQATTLKNKLVALRSHLGKVAKMDVCKGASDDTLVTYRLKYLAAPGGADVSVTRSEVPGSPGVTVVKQALPEGLTLKFTSLTCGNAKLTGLNMDEVGAVYTYFKNRAPLFVKTNSDPKYFQMDGEGGLTLFKPPEGTTALTDEQVTGAVAVLSERVGKVFSVNLLKKDNYTVDATDFKVTKTEVGGFNKFHHTLKMDGARDPAPFTVKAFLHGETANAVAFPTGLQVNWFSMYFNGDDPLYLHLKAHGPAEKYHHYVHDRGLWLEDGVHAEFDEEDLTDRLHHLKDGLGNEVSLDLAEDLYNPLFHMDSVPFQLVSGYMKFTYKPLKLEYPVLLKDLKLDGADLNLSLSEKHVSLVTAYAFRKNYLFFHFVTYDNKNLFYKANFRGEFVPMEFEEFNDTSLKRLLNELKAPLANQVSLELTKTANYEYHNYSVNVVAQTDASFEGYKKYMHDLHDGTKSVPFKLVSVKNNGHVSNVPAFNDLVYFAYVYHFDNEPVMLELHTSTQARSDYHYYYFVNKLGNWELLENPTLAQLQKSTLTGALEKSKAALAKTFKVDLARKFDYVFTNPATEGFTLKAVVGEDPRETMGFTLYSHHYDMHVATTASRDQAPTAGRLEAAVVLPVEAASAPALGAGAPPGPAVDPVASGLEAANAAATSSTGAARSEAPRAAVPGQATTDLTQVPSVEQERVVDGAPATVTALTTYQTLKADALRGVNVMSSDLLVVGKFTLKNEVQSGFGFDTVVSANVYWHHDKVPAMVHLYSGVDNKYFKRKGSKWVLARKATQALARSELAALLKEVKDEMETPVELDMDKSSDFDPYVKYVSDGFTLRVVPSYNLPEGFKGFTHFSATHYERAFTVNKLSLWGDVVVTKLPKGFVKSATVFTDGDLLPLAVELEWTRLDNSSFRSKFNYYKNTGTSTWAEHDTENSSLRLTDEPLLTFLKKVKADLGDRVLVLMEKRENYGTGAAAVTVAKDPSATPASNWNGFHKVTHTLAQNNSARVVVLKMGNRVVRAHHTEHPVKVVETFWYKNALLLVKLTVAGAPVAGAADQRPGPDTFLYFKNDHKDDLMPLDQAPADHNLVVATPSDPLPALAAPFKDHYQLDVAERTLSNGVDSVAAVPAVFVPYEAVPAGFARYNLYLLDHRNGLRLSKLLYHGVDVSTGHFDLPTHNVDHVYAFSPVGHFSPFLLELRVPTNGDFKFFYYQLNPYGHWTKLENGERRMTDEELTKKLTMMAEKLGNFTVLDVSKSEGTYYGLNKMNVTKFVFPGVRAYTKFLHKAHDMAPFTVSKFVNKGVVLSNLPVLKASHVSVYATKANKPLMLEFKVGGKYKFFSSNANGDWFEERLPSGDLKSALDSVYDEHKEVARLTRDLVSLQLNAKFVREYVLSEGKVSDFDGAVAVPAEEPAPAAALPAAPLLPAASETDPTPTSSAPASAVVVATAATTLQGAGRTVMPPAPTVTRTHVLNPVLYLDPDKQAYTYVSYGKSVFVSRRDDMFHGYNVSFHKLTNSEPFGLRKVVFLGREFDLGLGDEKLLSATLFSFLHKPLLLKLVHHSGVEKFKSFTFATQQWADVTVDNLETKLDHLNFEQNKMLMLDLGKSAEYRVGDKDVHVEVSAPFSGFKKVSNKLKKAHEALLANNANKERLKKEKQEQKELKRESYLDKKYQYELLTTDLEEVKGNLDLMVSQLGTLQPKEPSPPETPDPLLTALLTFSTKDNEHWALDSQTTQAKTALDEAERTKAKDLETKKAAYNEKNQQLTAKKAEWLAARDAVQAAKPTLPADVSEDSSGEKAKLRTLLEQHTPTVTKEMVNNALDAYKVLYSHNLKRKLDAALKVVEKYQVTADKDALKAVLDALKELKDAKVLVNRETFNAAVEKFRAELDKLPKPNAATHAKNLHHLKEGLKALEALKRTDFFDGALEALEEQRVPSESEPPTEPLAKEALNEKGKKVAEKLNEVVTVTKRHLSVTPDLSTEDFELFKKFKEFLVGVEPLTEELKTREERNYDEGVRVVMNVPFADEVLKKLEGLDTLVTKLKTSVNSVEELTTEQAQQPENVNQALNAVATLKAAVPESAKVKEAHDAFKKLKPDAKSADYEKLVAAVVAVNALNQVMTNLDNSPTQRKTGEELAKLRQSQLATMLKTAKFGKEGATKTVRESFASLDLTAHLPNLKQEVTAVKTELENHAALKLKVAAAVANAKYVDLYEKVVAAKAKMDLEWLNYERFSTDVPQPAPETEEALAALRFGFAGLRFLGKDLSSAGLPLGNHVHTLSAFFVNGFSKPLLVHMKYEESEDTYEPVREEVRVPPPAELLLAADRVVPTTSPQVRGRAAPTVVTAAPSAMERHVAMLLKRGLELNKGQVRPENGAVVATGSKAVPTSTAERRHPDSPPVDNLFYLGRYFEFDVDGTWKAFVPVGAGAVKAKLDELRAKHVKEVDLDLATDPGARNMENYLLNVSNFAVKRVLYSSGPNLVRDPANLHGTPAPVAHKVNLLELATTASVAFFPHTKFFWHVHNLVPVALDGVPVGDSLPEFNLRRLRVNGWELPLSEQAAAALGPVNSVSAVLNGFGTPLLVFLYKPARLQGVLQHKYATLAFNGVEYVLDDSFGNFHNLLYKLEHTDFSWNSDETFSDFGTALHAKLDALERDMGPSYAVDLGAERNYLLGNVVVNVDVTEAFDVKHVSYTPGLKSVPGAELPTGVPAFSVHKVFMGDTTFKGFKLPFKNVLHVSVFHWKFLHPLKATTQKEFTKFPLLVEFSFRNEFNRLEHFYFSYVGGNTFELYVKTKLRMTAAEVADSVKAVAHRNLRVSEARPETLELDFAVKTSHYTPRHAVTVEKLEKVAVPPAAGSPPGTQPTYRNPFVPEGFVVYKYSLDVKDPGYTSLALSFGNHWKHMPTRFNHNEFFVYVMENDTLPVLVAMGRPAESVTLATAATVHYDWFGLENGRPVVKFDTTATNPTLETDKTRVAAELASLTARLDFWLQPRHVHVVPVPEGTVVKLSPVGNVAGFPEVPMRPLLQVPKVPVPPVGVPEAHPRDPEVSRSPAGPPDPTGPSGAQGAPGPDGRTQPAASQASAGHSGPPGPPATPPSTAASTSVTTTPTLTSVTSST